MKIPAECQIERAVSEDITRQHLNHVLLDTEAKRVVATDGHMMAVVPVTDVQDDHAGLLSVDSIKAARKATPKTIGGAIMHANGKATLLNGQEFPRPDASIRFPSYQQVIPQYRKGDENTITVGIDAALLIELAKAIGASGKCRGQMQVNLTFPRVGTGESMLDPIRVDVGRGEAFGVLMPCRV